MRVPILALFIAAIVVLGGVARAEEPTLLEKLEAETTKLVDDARRAEVNVNVGSTSTRGVLVGEPPRLVASYAGIGTSEKVRFVLYNGTSGQATRVAADVELGIAVYDMPEGSVPEGVGLEAEAAWEHHPSRLAVLADETPRLVILRSPNGRYDGWRLGDPKASGLLLSARGRLLGLRATTTFTRTTSRAGRYEVVVPHFYGIPTAQVGGDVEIVLDRSVRKRRKDALTVLAEVLQDGSAVRELARVASPPNGACVLTPGTFLPGPLVARVLDDLREHGEIRHSYLGVVPAEAEDGRGARLVTVLPDSPAYRAGLREGQTVLAVHGQPVLDAANLTRQLVLRRPGDTLPLLVTGHRKPVDVVLGDRKTAEATIAKPKQLGLVTVNLTPDLALYLGLDKTLRGVVVNTVYDWGAAADAGLKRGDVILEGNGAPTRDIPELLAAFNSSQGRIDLKVLRAGKELKLQLELQRPRPKGDTR